MPDNHLAESSISNADKRLQLINDARAVSKGDRNLSAAELEKLYLDLEHYNQFAYATEVLLVKMKMDEGNGQTVGLKSYQKLALYIYKDHSLPSSFKFSKALQELQNHDQLSATTNCESLGLAGAIFKRRWQFDHQFKNLILSRYYYRRGYLSWKEYLQKTVKDASDIQNDDGYTAINYAYVNELMAVDKLEEHGEITGLSESIDARLLEAESIRIFILEQFIKEVSAADPELKNQQCPRWVLATIAEAYFGLRKYGAAVSFIEKYIGVSANKPWELRTFSQQLFSIAYLQESQKKFSDSHPESELPGETNLRRIVNEIKTEDIRRCLDTILKTNTEGDKDNINSATKIEIKKGGKLGLALSGGGFRASLFQIGTLAALAEKDELKNVEVISCVSGGSIIGAYYYLKLKGLLESKKDSEIDKKEYVKLIQEIETEFLYGVQKNLRVRIFSNPVCNLKMLFLKNYSRTHRLGELYEKHLYKKIWPKGKDIYMNDLFIKPKDAKEDFDIRIDNWTRINKVPQLILNATSVNTGHNWQFTASWMGEPPGNIQADIDVKPRLRRMYYEEAPGDFKQFRLGYAVGASSCVPVMFRPMPMYGLYPEIDLQLVDGGLHDNQGIAALIEQECSNMIISDASGQLPTNKIISDNEAAVFYRSDNILQERLRELQFMDLKERTYTAQINQLITVHLKNDLQKSPVSWNFCEDPPRKIMYANEQYAENEVTKFGVLKTIQAKLSEIRTDLDSFNNVEAYALMYDGYLQTHYEWNKQNNLSSTSKDEQLWNFTAIKDYVTKSLKAKEIEKILEVGNKLFFKIISLNIIVRVFAILLLISLLIFLGMEIIYNLDRPITNITIKGLVLIAILFFAGRIFRGVGFLVNRNSEIKKWLLLLGLTFVGFLISAFYVAILNPLYNMAGKIKK